MFRLPSGTSSRARRCRRLAACISARVTTTVTKLPQDRRVVNHDGVSLKLYYPEPCPLTGWVVVRFILFRRRRWCGPPYDSLKLVSGSFLGASGLSLVYLGSPGVSWVDLRAACSQPPG